MGLKIRKSTLKQGIILWVVLWMILFSKTVFFGIVYKSTYQWVFYASGILGTLLFGVSLKKVQRPVMRVLPFLFLLFFNAVFYMGNMTAESQNELIGIGLNFLVTSIICGYLDKEQFAKYYVYVMVVLCLISLPCFIIANTSESLAFSMCQPGYDWRTPYGYSLLYTWGWNGNILKRNAGPFWEAGAFQGFILLALLMILYGTDGGLIKEQRKKWFFLLFLISIITTGSTTGYILLIAVLITQWTRTKLLFSKLPSKIRYIFLFIVVAIAIAFIIQSGNIGAKFSGESTKSAFVRYSDLVNGLKMWTKSPLLGLGLTSKRQTLRAMLGVSSHDSVGLSFMAYTYGIPFLFYYLYCMGKSIKAFFKVNRWQAVMIFVIFIVLHMTEGLWWLPVYLYIALYTSPWEKP